MKEIKEEIQRTETITKYQAIDGTEFEFRDECSKYENTAFCVLNAKYKKLVLTSKSEYDLFDCGSDENIIDIVKPTSGSDIDIIMQMLAYTNNYLFDEKHKERLDYITNTCARALKENDLLFIYKGYEDDGFWPGFTRNQRIEALQNLDKESDKQ